MHRPSWNKSQAIQQVLSLKSLFESKSNQQSKKPSKHNPATLELETARDSTVAQSSVSQEQILVSLINHLPIQASKRVGNAIFMTIVLIFIKNFVELSLYVSVRGFLGA